MAWTIGPAGRGAKGRRAVTVYAIGTIIAGLTMALLLLLLAPAVRAGLTGDLRSAGALVAAAICVGWIPRTLGFRGPRYPRSRWQVPEHWRQTMHMDFTLLVYGFLLGLGFLTDVVLPAYWVLLVGSLVVGSMVSVICCWLLYGAVRAAVVGRGARRYARLAVDEPPPEICTLTQLRVVRAVAAVALLAVASLLVFS